MRLSASDLACLRGNREVFSNLNFEVVAGEVLSVTGPNGAGKSSLLRLIAGLLQPAAGRLVLEEGDPELTLAEQSHYISHQDALKPSLSVAENLAFWGRYLGVGAAPTGRASEVWAHPATAVSRPQVSSRCRRQSIVHPPDWTAPADQMQRGTQLVKEYHISKERLEQLRDCSMCHR